jgi:hypothetical protein
VLWWFYIIKISSLAKGIVPRIILELILEEILKSPFGFEYLIKLVKTISTVILLDRG